MKVWRAWWRDADEGACYAWSSSRRTAERELAALRRDAGAAGIEPSGVEPVEIPTDRAGLVRWLNRSFTRNNG